MRSIRVLNRGEHGARPLLRFGKNGKCHLWCCVIVTVLAIMAGCGSETLPTPPSEPRPASIELAPRDLVMSQGERATMTATVRDMEGHVMSGADVIFTSRNPNVVSIALKGGQMTTGRSGVAYVLGRVSGFTDSVPIEIVSVPARIHVQPSGISMAALDDVRLHGRVLDVVEDTLPELEVTFELAPSDVVSLDAENVVRSVGPLGTANITASAPDLPNARVPVIIGTHPDGVHDSSLPVGMWVAANAPPDDAVTASNGWIYRGPFAAREFTDSLALTGSGNSRSIKTDATGTISIASLNGNLVVVDWSARTATEIEHPMAGATFGAVTVCIEGRGRFALVSSLGGSNVNLYKIHLASFTVAASTTIDAFSLHCVAHPSGSAVFFSSPETGRVFSVDPVDLSIHTVGSFRGVRPQGIALDPMTDRLYVVLENADAVVSVDAFARVGRNQTQMPGPPGGFGAAISPDGSRLYVTYPREDELGVFNLDLGFIIDLVAVSAGPRAVVFSRFGNHAMVGSEHGGVDFIR